MKPRSVTFTSETRADTSISARKGEGNFRVSKYTDVSLEQNQEIYINSVVATLCMHCESLKKVSWFKQGLPAIHSLCYMSVSLKNKRGTWKCQHAFYPLLSKTTVMHSSWLKGKKNEDETLLSFRGYSQNLVSSAV